jgi:hypothetical protein
MSAVKHTILDTIHFSMACDMYVVVINIHWREDPLDGEGDPNYFMEEVEGGLLYKMRDMGVIRALLRNKLDWAMDPRLGVLKKAIVDVREGLGAKAGGKSEGTASSVADLVDYRRKKQLHSDGSWTWVD